jgi:hypothetical protein
VQLPVFIFLTRGKQGNNNIAQLSIRVQEVVRALRSTARCWCWLPPCMLTRA